MTGNSPPASLVDCYTPEAFVSGPGWDALERVLNGRGVCCGVGGNRGAGKSWLLQHAVHRTGEANGVGIHFSSPRDYDPLTFLSALCSKLAEQVESVYRPPTRLDGIVEWGRRAPVRIAILLMVIGVGAFIAGHGTEAILRWLPWAAIGSALLLLYVSGPAIVRDVRIRRNPNFAVYIRAQRLRQWIQFSTTSKATTEATIEAGKGLLARGRTSREISLSERPVTELSLVSEFRGLAEAVTATGAKLVVAIDELDKIESVDMVRALLRGIKGVLDPVGVILLVALSDEAAVQLRLGGLAGRNEITSSFATMLRVPSLTTRQCEMLIKTKLGVPRPRIARVLHVVAAGVPRDIVRLLDEYIRHGAGPSGEPPPDDPLFCAALALELEADDFVTALLAEPGIGEAERVCAFRWLRRHVMGRNRVADVRPADILAVWDPPWATDGNGSWPVGVGEHWRHFLLRAATIHMVWQHSISNPSNGIDVIQADGLCRMLRLSTMSAAAARFVVDDDELGVFPRSQSGRFLARLRRRSP